MHHLNGKIWFNTRYFLPTIVVVSRCAILVRHNAIFLAARTVYWLTTFFSVVVVVAVGRKPLIKSQYQEILVDDKVTTINLDVGSNLTLVAGSRVKVICEADGVPEPSITWQQDGEEVPSSWNKTSLTIDNPGQVNLRTVSCTANNVLGIDTKASYFTILGKKLLQFQV